MAITDDPTDRPLRPLDRLPRFDLAWDESQGWVTVYSPDPASIETQWISVDAAYAIDLDAIA